MAGSAVPPTRASDDDRDRVVDVLREAAVDGRLSQDSFVRRVDLALRAVDHASLADLVADLRPSRVVLDVLRSGLAVLADRFAPQPSRMATLSLPDQGRPVVMIGRRPDCDVVLTDATVSRVHAVLMLFADQWFIDDRGSKNGTRVNGRRIWGSTQLLPGDRVGLGRLTFRVVAPVPRGS